MKIANRVKSDFPIQERGLLHYMREHCDDNGLFHQPQRMMADGLDVTQPFICKWTKRLVANNRITVHEPATMGHATTYMITQVIPITQVITRSPVIGNTDSIDSKEEGIYVTPTHTYIHSESIIGAESVFENVSESSVCGGLTNDAFSGLALDSQTLANGNPSTPVTQVTPSITQVTPKKPLIIIAEPEPTRVVMIGDPDQKCLSLTNTRCKNQPLPNRQMCGPCEDEMVRQAQEWRAKKQQEMVTV